VTVWLWRTRRAAWVWLVTGVPMVWMYVMSTWALVGIIETSFAEGVTANPVPWVAVVLVALAALMLVEAVRSIFGTGARPEPPYDAATVTAAA
jgi:carbon starvation protein